MQCDVSGNHLVDGFVMELVWGGGADFVVTHRGRKWKLVRAVRKSVWGFWNPVAVTKRHCRGFYHSGQQASCITISTLGGCSLNQLLLAAP